LIPVTGKGFQGSFPIQRDDSGRPVLVNGGCGNCLATSERAPFSVMSFVVRLGKMTEIDRLRDPAHLSRLDLMILDL
jgi:hypothetical protein